MTTVNAQTVSRNVVVDTIYRAVRGMDYIKNKWVVGYFDHSQWVSLYSIKSGMEVLFPVIIKIEDGVVELRSEKAGDWAFFTHRPEDGPWSEEITEVLASVLEDELTRFISRYWAKK